MHADTYAGAARTPLSPPAALLAPAPAAGHHACLEAPARLPPCSPRLLSLQLHIPCFDEMPVPVFGGLATYLAYLKREAAMRAALLDGTEEVAQLRFAGLSPACLDAVQLEGLIAHLRRHFRFASDEAGEFEARADPRGASPERIARLRRLGFNCIGLDVRDDGAEPARVRGVAAAARAAGFRSLRVVFGYGLPGQGADLLHRMLATIVKAGPDRVTLRPHDGGACGELAQRMRLQGVKQLRAAGYVDIGGDCYALPGGQLSGAPHDACAPSSVFGIPLHGAVQTVGCGVTAIGMTGALRSRNVAAPGDYYALLERNELPLARGLHGMAAA